MNKRSFLLTLICLLIGVSLSACRESSQAQLDAQATQAAVNQEAARTAASPSPTHTSAPTSTLTPIPTNTPTSTSSPTYTPSSTPTATLTPTPEPTDTPVPTETPTSTVTPSPTLSPSVASQVAMPLGPVDLVIQDGWLYTANILGDSVMKLRLSDGAVVSTFPIADDPAKLLAEGEFLWVVAAHSNEVIKLRQSDGDEVGRFVVGENPIALASDGEFLWVANCVSNNLSKLRLSDGMTVATFSTSTCPGDLVVEGDTIWAFSRVSNEVTRLYRSDGSLVGKYPFLNPNIELYGEGARYALLVEDYIWVAHGFGLSRLRVSDGSLVETYPDLASALVSDGNFLWTANEYSDTISKLSLTDGTRLAIYPLKDTIGSAKPAALAIYGDSLWVANFQSNDISRVNIADGSLIATYPLGSRASSSERITRIPGLEIPERLFFPQAGNENLSEDTSVLYSEGDWILVAGRTTTLPIPKGWATIEDGVTTTIFPGTLDNPENIPPVYVSSGGMEFGDDTSTSTDAVKGVEERAGQNPNVTLLRKEIVDANKGYVFGTQQFETGEKEYFLQLMYVGEGWYYVFLAVGNGQYWNDYYPIIQAMAARWVGMDNTWLGVSLPDNLQ